MGAAGANLRELMERMGHGTTRAALIYQHRTTERDRLIADAMGKLAEAELRKPKRPIGHAAGTKAQAGIVKPLVKIADHGPELGLDSWSG